MKKFEVNLIAYKKKPKDMNERYQQLKSSLDEWACNAMAVFSGEAILYDDFPPVEDAIFGSLHYQKLQTSTACCMLY